MADPIDPGAVAPDESAPAQEATKRAYEDWAREKHPCAIDDRGKASSVIAGKRKFKMSNAAIVNAARSYKRIPLGRLMTEAEFDAAIDAAKSIVIK